MPKPWVGKRRMTARNRRFPEFQHSNFRSANFAGPQLVTISAWTGNVYWRLCVGPRNSSTDSLHILDGQTGGPLSRENASAVQMCGVGADAGEDVSQPRPRLRIDAIHLACGDEAANRRGAIDSAIRPSRRPKKLSRVRRRKIAARCLTQVPISGDYSCA
jgi:hypothetical protein